MTILLCAWVVGCGAGGAKDGPKGIAVKGKVTFDGQPVAKIEPGSKDDDKPTDRGSIVFASKDSKVVYNATIADGRYSFLPSQGLEAGSYRVEIHWTKPSGKKVRDRDSGDVEEAVIDQIPPKYNKQSTLSADVSADKTTFDFDLTK